MDEIKRIEVNPELKHQSRRRLSLVADEVKKKRLQDIIATCSLMN
jgi:hypothetical protein